MIAERKDITSFVPLKNVVRRAVMDTWGDFEKDQARYQAWAIDGLKKLSRETLKSGKRPVVLNINRNLMSAVLPCDFKEEIFVGIIDNYGEKIPLNINPNIVNNFLIRDEIPCDQPCEAKCGCYPKSLCNDLQTTQVINKILINDTEYDQTVTTTLLPNGEYYKVTTTPVMNMVTSGIDYIDSKEYITTFDTETCGCIKPTERNDALLEACNWDLYCCYCTSCRTSNTDFGGYKIFYETGTIHFDGAFIYDKCYLEYRGSLPKSGNEYLVPEVAYDTLIEMTKWYAVRNKKGMAQITIDRWYESYTRERTNMTKVMGRMSLADIIHSALLVPQFNYNSNGCYTPCSVSTRTITSAPLLVTSTQYVNVPSPAPPLGNNPTIITFEGSEASGGTIYTNPLLADALSVRIFANPFNRFLTASEFNFLPGGRIELLTGVYGAGDWFDIFPKWTSSAPAPTPPVPSNAPVTFVLSGNGTYVVPLGYVAWKISIKPSAADTVRIGLTLGGDEIMFDKVMTTGIFGNNGVTYDVYAETGPVTIYFTGFTAAATINIYLLPI